MAGSSAGSAGSAARKAPTGETQAPAPAKKAPARKAPARKTPATQAPATQAPATQAPTAKAPTGEAPAKKVPARRPPAASAGAARSGPPGAEAAGALVVRPDEEPWSAAELAEVHTELDVDVERLTGEVTDAETDLAELLRDFGDGAGEDQADAGTKTFEREHEMSLANNTREMLVQSTRALRRIDDGTYGICENCGKPIGKARLQAFPRATLCMTCKQREERR